MTPEERNKKAQELIEKIREQGLINEESYPGYEDLLAVLQTVLSSVFGSAPGRPRIGFY